MSTDRDRIIALEHGQADLRADVDGLMSEVGGIHVGNGNHEPLRTRVHKLESNDESARLLAQAAKDFRQGRNDAWSTWLKVLVTGAAVMGALGTVADLLR